MKKLNRKSYAGKKALESHCNVAGHTLQDVYKNPSNLKQKAFDQCLEMCMDEGGAYFHICSFNTFGFTVSWETTHGVRMETPKSSYFIPWAE